MVSARADVAKEVFVNIFFNDSTLPLYLAYGNLYLDMSRILAELLGVQSLTFRLNLEQLEKASGNPSADIHLTTEIEQQTRSKMRELELDPEDTTAEELDEALREKLRNDDKRLENKLLGERHAGDRVAPLIASTIRSLDIPKGCFALRHSVAKRMIKKNPPKTTMRKLGYRSVDSLLKRESPTVIFVLASVTEPQSWKQHFYEGYKLLTPSDFEVRDIEVFHPIRTTSWETLASNLASQQQSTVMISKELGGIVLLPLPREVVGVTLATMLLTLQAINDIRIHSAFCKLQQVKPDFGSVIADSIKGDVRSLVLMAGQPLPWHVIQSFYSHQSKTYPVELFEPHVQQEDLVLSELEETITEIEPSLAFWRGTSWLGFDDSGKIVSMNICDIAISTVNDLSFNNRLLNYFRDQVWKELMTRYLQQEQLEQNVLRQLDAQLVQQPSEPNFEINFAGA